MSFLVTILALGGGGSGGSGGSGGAQATLEGQQRAAAQGGGAVRGRQDALRLDVGLLTLGSGVLRDSQVADP